MRVEASTDDRTLVRASQRGDQEAFGTLVSRHARAVLSVTVRMLGAGADAEDVAQETFVAAYRALSTFQGDARFSTWLYRIAVNKCTDALRARQKRHVSIDTADEGRPWEIQDDETPLHTLEQSELACELEREIRALPHIYRESFVLRHIEGLTYDEMSAIIGVHRDTLKMRVYKARHMLCRSLAHLNGAHR